MKKVIVIPARLSSTRLPRKVLLDLKGKTVIHRVFEQCTRVNGAEVYIATDNDEVVEECKKFTSNVILTDPKHQSGTDRIAEAIQNIDCEIIVNVQGDEPFIDPLLIDQLFKSFEIENATDMASVMERIHTVEDLTNPNVVKVVTDINDKALYFSRSIIPYCREGIETILNSDNRIKDDFEFYRHIGIYGYKKDFLLKYSRIQQSSYEKLEKLEQLRVLEHGFNIKMIETKSTSLGIDTIEDYKKALELIK